MSACFKSQVIRVHSLYPNKSEDESTDAAGCDDDNAYSRFLFREELVAVTNRKDVNDAEDDAVTKPVDQCEVGKVLAVGGEVHDEGHGDACHEASHA